MLSARGRYRKGVRKEQKVVNELKEAGYDIVQRTAGSHSPIDIIAISKDTKGILFIQCKSDKLPNSEKVKICKEMEWLDGEFNVEFDVE